MLGPAGLTTRTRHQNTPSEHAIRTRYQNTPSAPPNVGNQRFYGTEPWASYLLDGVQQAHTVTKETRRKMPPVERMM